MLTAMSFDGTIPERSRTVAGLAGGVTGLLALAAVGLSALILIGGLSSQDPLEGLIPVDKVRHLLAFTAFGLCAGLSPKRWLCVLLTCCGLGLAGSLEWAQGVLTTTRTPSLSDFSASCIGLFAGAGAGSFLLQLSGLILSGFRAGLRRRAR